MVARQRAQIPPDGAERIMTTVINLCRRQEEEEKEQ